MVKNSVAKSSPGTRLEKASFGSTGFSCTTEIVPFALGRSRYGASTIPTFGSNSQTAAGRAATGSCTYWRRSSSATGNIGKYEKRLLTGVISERRRRASSSTVVRARPLGAGILKEEGEFAFIV